MRPLRILSITLAVVAAMGMSAVVIAAPTPESQSSTGRVYSKPMAEPTRATPTKTKTPELQETDIVSKTNRVAVAIAEFFQVSVEDVLALHESGKGYGGIVKAYALAERTGKSVDEIFAMRSDEQGWGVILKSLSVAKWDQSVGKIMHGTKGNSATEEESSPGKSGKNRPDKEKGKGKGKNKD